MPYLSLIYFPSFGSSSLLLAIPVLLLSTIFLVTFTKKKKNKILAENPVQDDQNLTFCSKNLLLEQKPQQPVLQTAAQLNTTLQCEVDHEQEQGLESLESPSESESSSDSISIGNFEILNNVTQNGNISDYSVSEDEDDEDSLIEITLPVVGGEAVDFGEEQKQKQDWSLSADILSDSIFKQQGLMELFEEINGVNDNEEDNLIEIDISMGSIKCPTFEIEASD